MVWLAIAIGRNVTLGPVYSDERFWDADEREYAAIVRKHITAKMIQDAMRGVK